MPLRTVNVPPEFAELFAKAEQLVSEFFQSQSVDPTRGTIEIFGSRYVLIRGAALSVEFFALVRKLFGADEEAEADAFARTLLYDLAHAVGKSDAANFHEKMALTDPIAKLSAGPVHFAHSGWAFVEIGESHAVPGDDFVLVYDHRNSFEADAWRRAGLVAHSPACVMNAGYSSGWCEESFGMFLEAAEISCRACGDEQCRFIMASPQRIQAHIAGYESTHPQARIRRPEISWPDFFAREKVRIQTAQGDADARARSTAEARLLMYARQLESTQAILKEKISQLEVEIRERTRAETRLRENEERFRAITENSSDVTLISDVAGNLAYASPAVRRVLGLSPDELLAKTPEAMIHPDDLPAVMAALNRVAGGAGRSVSMPTFRVRHADGHWVYFEGLFTGLGEGPGTNDIVVNCRDLTERRRLELQIQHAQKLESLGVLAGGIAHDFNNLLAVVLGNAELALQDLPGDSLVRGIVEQIRLAALRGSELTNQMLAYSGKGRFEVRTVDLNQLVREMANLLDVSISKKVAITLELGEGVAPIQGDVAQLRQVVMNLITNASEAIGDRPGEIRVRTATREIGDEFLAEALPTDDVCVGRATCFEVADTGAGMTAEARNRIFDPFFTTKFTGRGLGLAAVLGIVRGHGGAIRVESMPGAGSTFTVCFPASDGVVSTAPEPVRPRPTSWQGSGVVLVADDEAAVRAVAKLMLERIGFSVLLASDGRDAVEKFRASAGHLTAVLLDMTMPEMSGDEVFRELQAIDAGVPVVLCSGYSEQDTIANFSARGLAGFLQKPFQFDALYTTIRAILAER